MPTAARVAVLSGVERITIEERLIPEVKADEALVKIEACGICGSDVRAYQSGRLFPVGTVMGHECAGTVAAVGPGVQDFAAGDRVVVFGYTPCGACVACRRGLTSYCLFAQERTIGHTEKLAGGFADYLWLPRADSTLVHLPEGVTSAEASLTEPLWTPLQAIRSSRFKPGDAVAVLGAGPIGLGMIQFLKLGGAGSILSTEISPLRSGVARKIGADVVLDPTEDRDRLQSIAAEMSDGLGVDVVFECSGVPAAFQQALQLVRPGGQIMQVGIIEGETSISPRDLVHREIDLRGSLGYSKHDFEVVLDFIARRQIERNLFISAIIGLEELEEKGFKRLISARDAVKIIVRP